MNHQIEKLEDRIEIGKKIKITYGKCDRIGLQNGRSCMKAQCTNCGQLYRINTPNIESAKANFKCKKCQGTTLMTIGKDEFPAEMNSETVFNKQALDYQRGTSKNGIGLRPKMVLLFVVIPIIFVSRYFNSFLKFNRIV